MPSHLNPIDAATRDSSIDILSAINVWLKGPEYILHDNELLDEDSDDFPLIEPENDKVQVLKSTILTYKPVSERFTHHSSWNRLVNAFTVLRHIARSYRRRGTHHANDGICARNQNLLKRSRKHGSFC